MDQPVEKPPFKYRLIMSLVPLAVLICRLIRKSQRVHVIDPHKVSPAIHHTPSIYVFWHDHQLGSMSSFPNLGIYVLASKSRDGDYISKALELFGFNTVRSSSSSGKLTALRGMARAIRQGSHVAITPDGPRGPKHECRPGAVFLAAMTGVKIIPIGCATEPCWRMKSWDRFIIPKPFSRMTMAFGEPLAIPTMLDETQVAVWVAELEKRLNRAEAQAEADVAQGRKA